ncbi:S-layer homology domain-containing protein [Aquibacillus sediminis]|uniref:S-layer homology domain-containing protein n=1 Tax=Aquibacillus sediminis TaxID=2574734 RepID=UPI0011097C6C|nr:S-layer homology domain-containing protein [Aquibacillus sediminis]
MRKVKPLLVGLVLAMVAFAQVGSVAASDAQSDSHENPPTAEINQLLTEAAIEHDVPPEIVKAIAWQESRWRQFDSDGNPLLNASEDGGIGIMQVTLSDSYFDDNPEEKDKLSYDIDYNIEIGIDILLEKWELANKTYAETALPVINDGSKEKLENWYFAVMAYNGRSEINDPTLDEQVREEKYGHTISDEYGAETYQDKVYRHIEQNSFTTVPLVKPSQLDLEYKPDSSLIYFNNKLHYNIDASPVKSHQVYEQGDTIVTTGNVNLRDAPDGEVIREQPLPEGELLQLTGEMEYPSSQYNHFVWYPIETEDGEAGYVASSYVDLIRFNDFHAYSPNHRGLEEVNQLVDQGIIGGFNDDTFRPKQTLTRVQAALMFVRALELPTPDVDDTGFADVQVGEDFYREIAAAKEAGIFRGAGGEFNRSEKLTRSEMAAVLARAFKISGESDKQFTDIPKGHQFEAAIQALYANDITKGINQSEFGFHDPITRQDFSILMYKTIDAK